MSETKPVFNALTLVCSEWFNEVGDRPGTECCTVEEPIYSALAVWVEASARHIVARRLFDTWHVPGTYAHQSVPAAINLEFSLSEDALGKAGSGLLSAIEAHAAECIYRVLEVLHLTEPEQIREFCRFGIRGQ